MTFGVIKSRFNCLRGLRVSPERACETVVACVVLHNIAVIRKERAPHVPLVAADLGLKYANFKFQFLYFQFLPLIVQLQVLLI